ncbi:hypothetical protein [Actinosynnema mirum]|uniref:Uncharacterized protein n=1 Tax=Actinosynnema mirum (strain ATCC 29888 / DSM 43827 / JCM 3225 / NBRC 14064 / NCIMB 13271 / NRRL B-12336 / IMRU 3971 / 101) TaxID=446462 RepID=C6WE20_ACTMD|nr:hypothetical protein [Actinosynnema mirum]ACU35763.1 hypothetical protein Amir_1815 [Actinosynnema mirum DSM 43827]
MFWLFFGICAVAFTAGAVLSWLPMRATIRDLRAELRSRPVVEIDEDDYDDELDDYDEDEILDAEIDEDEDDLPAPRPTPARVGVKEVPALPARAPRALEMPGNNETTQVIPRQVRANSRTRVFHTPDSPYFDRMRGDVEFSSIAEAEEAGYTRWRPKAATPTRPVL